MTEKTLTVIGVFFVRFAGKKYRVKQIFVIRLTRDGKLDSWERAERFQFMDGMIKDDENEWVSCTKI